jgi:uncharacterized membrane protein YciS (DUF1049 family)
MDFVASLPLLRALGFGVAGGTVITGIFYFWVFVSIRNHDSKICKNEKSLADHNTTLAVLESGQKEIDKKLTQLINIHLNGGSKK